MRLQNVQHRAKQPFVEEEDTEVGPTDDFALGDALTPDLLEDRGVFQAR